jgi:hypothetical protein
MALSYTCWWDTSVSHHVVLSLGQVSSGYREGEGERGGVVEREREEVGGEGRGEERR